MIKLNVNEYETLLELKQKLCEILNKPFDEPPLITKMKGIEKIQILNKEKFVKNILESGEELVIYERPMMPSPTVESCFLIELKIT